MAVVKNNLVKNLYPELFKLIHPTMNENIDINKLTTGCDKNIYFICPKCPLLYFTTVGNRIKSLKTKIREKCIHKTPKMTQEEFLKIAKQYHNDKYDYSKTIYKSHSEYIEFVCKDCGKENRQISLYHLKNGGCKGCSDKQNALNRKRKTEQFIIESKKVHGEFAYNYDFVKYERSDVWVDLFCNVCKTHIFQTPSNNLKFHCRNCSNINIGLFQRKTTEDFIEKARKKHNSLYDYSRVEYKGSKELVEIVCKICGPFWQVASNHCSGQGCPSCANKKKKESPRKTTEYFIKKSTILFGEGNFDYSLTKYISYKSRVTLQCLRCKTVLNSRVQDHYRSTLGCYFCATKQIRLSGKKSTEEFIKEAIALYGPDKFDFSRTEYTKNNVKVILGCKCGEWFEQSPSNFLIGSTGCFSCRKKQESKGASNCRKYLTENNIDFKCETKFEPYLYRYDFTFEYNSNKICLEFDGEQHFEFIEYFHKTEKEFERRKEMDVEKNLIAKDNNHVVIRISNNKFEHISNYLDDVLENFEDEKFLYVDDEFRYQYMF